METNMLHYCPPLHFIYMRFKLWVNHMGNWGTPWEDDGNTLGRRVKKQKIPPRHPKEKNLTPHECMLSLLIG
jgi:hypothetical protein